MDYYLQTKNVLWLNTPKGTYWVVTEYPYIQPQQEHLISTPLGVNLDLADDYELFEKIETIDCSTENKKRLTLNP